MRKISWLLGVSLVILTSTSTIPTLAFTIFKLNLDEELAKGPICIEML